MRLPKPVLLPLLPFFLLLTAGHAEDWRQWRGPDGRNRTDRNLVSEWSAERNIRWKAAVEGVGYSSPIVVGGRVYLTTAREKKQEQLALCLDRASGKRLWTRVLLRNGFMPKHPKNSHASSTPAGDGKLVFTVFLNADALQVFALNPDGQEVWRRTLGPFNLAPDGEGYASSPVVYGSTLIVLGDNRKNGFLTGLNSQTGEPVWHTPRKNEGSFCSPVLVRDGKKDQLILTGLGEISSYDPATGALIWKTAGTAAATANAIAYGKDTLLASGGAPEKDMRCVGLHPAKPGAGPAVHWQTHKKTTYVPSPLYDQGHYYVVNDTGLASCYEEFSGALVWSERLDGSFKSSPLLAGDRIFACSETGETFVFKTGKTFARIATNPLPEPILASPVPSGTDLLIRSRNHLYCIGIE